MSSVFSPRPLVTDVWKDDPTAEMYLWAEPAGTLSPSGLRHLRDHRKLLRGVFAGPASVAPGDNRTGRSPEKRPSWFEFFRGLTKRRKQS